jgi:hypothetical protein
VERTIDLAPVAVAKGNAWSLSWPLAVGVLSYLYLWANGVPVLRDGDTFWHIAAGQWILSHGAVPDQDIFSHTIHGAPWLAHEWLSEVVLALAHQAGGLTVVLGLTAVSFGVTSALLMRVLLRWLEPIHALLLTLLAVAMTTPHALARPHMLAIPLWVIWTSQLAIASEERRAPSLFLLPVMVVWANLHGSFTLGIGLAAAFALEAVLAAWGRPAFASTVRAWALFVGLAVAFALVTPHGWKGLAFTWQVMVEDEFAMRFISEWQSPNFQVLQPFEVWLIGAMALALHQGLKLPVVRLVMLLGFVHLALKHMRNVELVGLIGAIVIAEPLGRHLRERALVHTQAESIDRFFRRLAQPTGAALIAAVGLLGATHVTWQAREHPVQPPESSVPARALQAARDAGVKGNVLNDYAWGGFLIYSGVPVFIDGRSDVYRDAFIRAYVDAIGLSSPDAFRSTLRKYDIAWTLLRPDTPAVALLDNDPRWRRVYADNTAVVQVRLPSPATPATESTP